MTIQEARTKTRDSLAVHPVEESAIYEKIHAAVVERRLLPGVRLVEDQLAEVFGVSRMRIRSVLRSLAHDKIVTIHRNRGAVVAYPSVREAREVFAARRLIEVALAPDIVDKSSPTALQRLRTHVKREKQIAGKSNRALELKTSHDFHTMLAEVTSNRVVVEFLRELMTRSLLITAVYERPDVSSCSHQAHGHLIDFIERGDVEGLTKAMRQHLDEIENDLVLFERQEFSADIRTVFGS
ncbi:MAG: GntR family transcriptional regulator [Gammaproteobacteria bacterium]